MSLPFELHSIALSDIRVAPGKPDKDRARHFGSLGNLSRSTVLHSLRCALWILGNLHSSLGSWENLSCSWENFARTWGLVETCCALRVLGKVNALMGLGETCCALWVLGKPVAYLGIWGNFLRTWGPGLALGDAWQHLALEGKQLLLPLHEPPCM